ncbi:MAG: nitroreductase [Tissierellia bacterium]|nr:nitroreductase [Tissierellia bacterium]
MNINDSIKNRHSVRKYTEKKIEGEVLESLNNKIDEINTESGLNIQLVTDEPKAFQSSLAKYGKFSGVNNYIVLIGKKGRYLSETCGYYGQKLVLYAQSLGLNTCWVALTYNKVDGAYRVASDEKLACVIAIGYGENHGTKSNSKSVSDVIDGSVDEMPEWFLDGVESALLAPTAVNQQKFKIKLVDENEVDIQPGLGFYTNIDLGIVKYHFEVGAGSCNFEWA